MHTHAPAESDRDYRSGPPDADISFRWSGYYEQRYFQPLALVAILAVLYALSSWLLIISHGALVKVSAGIMIGLCCGKFFVIGHDACHGSYTPSRLLNLSDRALGSRSFLSCIQRVEALAQSHPPCLYKPCSRRFCVAATFPR
jgi:hypothetical protein